VLGLVLVLQGLRGARVDEMLVLQGLRGARVDEMLVLQGLRGARVDHTRRAPMASHLIETRTHGFSPD
jgi:hypothetical protein